MRMATSQSSKISSLAIFTRTPCTPGKAMSRSQTLPISVSSRLMCTAVHINLLETLIGKVCDRLMALPGVQGVRVKIAKLEIFDDCEVAIRMETGQW